MSKKRRKYSKELRDVVVARMRAGANVRGLSWESHIAPSVLYAWRDKAEDEPGGKRYEGNELGKEVQIARLRAQVRDLEAEVGRRVMEVDFLGSALRRVGAKIPSSRNAGKKISGPKSAAGSIRKAH